MSELEQLQQWPSLFASRSGARRILAHVLVRASSRLARLADSLAADQRPAGVEPLVEFHAESGAPEGALFVDGRLVGWIAGVSRL